MSNSADLPAEPRALFEQAAQLIRADDHDAAEVLLADSLSRFPNDPNLLRLQGISLARRQRFAEAEAKFTHVVRLVPGHSRVHQELADVQMRQRKMEDAVQSLRNAAKHEPHGPAPQRLGELLSLMGRDSEAEAAFEASLAADPQRRRLAEAMELVQQGDLKQAEKRYRDMIRSNPEDVDALRLLGVLLVRRELIR